MLSRPGHSCAFCQQSAAVRPRPGRRPCQLRYRPGESGVVAWTWTKGKRIMWWLHETRLITLVVKSSSSHILLTELHKQ